MEGKGDQARWKDEMMERTLALISGLILAMNIQWSADTLSSNDAFFESQQGHTVQRKSVQMFKRRSC